MNIFVTSPSYKESAKALDIKRKNKMLIESAQMLCSAVQFYGGDAPYKPTHVNHPCSIWARVSLDNWQWLYCYMMELGEAYYQRTNKVHLTVQKMYDAGLIHKASQLIPHLGMTPFVNCATNHKHVSDVHEAYKQELEMKWKTDKRTPVFE